MAINFADVKGFKIGGTEITKIAIGGTEIWRKPLVDRPYYLPSEDGWAANDTANPHYLRFKIIQTENADGSLKLTISLECRGSFTYPMQHLLGDVTVNGTKLIASGQSDHYFDFGGDSTWRQARNGARTPISWEINVPRNTTTVPFKLGSVTSYGDVFQLFYSTYNAVWSTKTANLSIIV